MKYFITLLGILCLQPLWGQLDADLFNRLRDSAQTAFVESRFEDCVEITDHLADTLRRSGDYQGYVMFSMYNGWTHLIQLRDVKAAERYAVRALDTMHATVGESFPHLPDLYSLLSGVYHQKGNFEKGIEYQEKGLFILQERGMTGQYPEYVQQSNLGLAYLEHQRYQTALPYLRHGLSILEGLRTQYPDDTNLMILLSKEYAKIASCLIGLNDTTGALADARRGWHYRNMTGIADSHQFHNINLIMALAHSHAGHRDSAMFYFRQLDTLVHRHFQTAPVRIAGMYREMAEHELRYADLERALACNDSALRALGLELAADQHLSTDTMASSYCYHCEPAYFEQRVRILFRMGKSGDDARQHLQAALTTAERGLARLEDLRATLNYREGSKQALFDQYASLYSYGGLAAARLYAMTHDMELLERSFALSEAAKASVLLEALLATDAVAALTEEEQRLEEDLAIELIRCEGLYEAALAAQDTLGAVAVANGALFRARQGYDAFVESLRSDHPEYFDAVYASDVVDAGEVQALLAEDEVLLSYVVHEQENVLQIFAIDHQGIQNYTQPWSDSTEQQIVQFVNALDNRLLVQNRRRRAFIQASHDLYATLLEAPLRSGEEYSKLIIIPNGPLVMLPFEVLVQNQTDLPFDKLDYVLRDKVISYQYSSPLLVRSRTRDTDYTRELLAFAPVFDGAGQVHSVAVRDQTGLDTSYTSVTHDGWAALPQSEAEVQQISALFAPDAVVHYTRAAATETALRAALQVPTRFIHIASHSFANYVDPRYSGIACAAEDGSADGILRANEIAGIRSRSDLVVMSSCESGKGPLRRGEGMIGLNRSFIQQGARCVLFSHWKVDDQATSRLMVSFYAEVQAGKSYAEALRLAKLAMINDPVSATPAYWSAFTLIGS